ncbi:MAG: fibronectin type III domain-containing protein [Pseudomonadota bacterium]
MADFIIRPDGDSDWTNAVYLQAPLPVTAQDAISLGLTLGTNYQIGQVGTLASFSVTDVPGQIAAPALAPGTDQITATLAASPADNGAAISQFDLRYSTDQSNWAQLLDIASPTVIGNLTMSTAYFVQTRAVNANGAGDWSVSAQATTGADGAPNIPDPIGSDPNLEIADGGLFAVDALTVTFRLTDDPPALTVTNRTAALVPLAEYTGNEQNASAWVNGVFTSQQAVNDEVTLTATAPGTHVMVWEAREADHATNPPNPRRWSNGAASTAQVLLDNPPGVMGQPSLAATETTITVTFGADPAPGVAPITRYDIRCRLSPSGSWLVNQDVIDGAVLTGLPPSTAHDIETRAANAPGGPGPWSPTATISTLAGAGDVTPPSAANTAVGAQDQDGNIDVIATTLSEDAPNSFFVMTNSATPPSQAQVIAGQDHTGATAFAGGGFSMTQAMPNDTLTGLPDVNGSYHVYVVYGDAVPNYSDVLYAGPVTLNFSTSQAPVIEQQLAAYNSSNTINAGSALETSPLTIGTSTNRMLIAAVTAGTPGANDDLTNCTATFGAAGRTQGTGTSMTLLPAGSGNRRTHTLFFALPAPASGAGTVQITAGNDNMTCGAVRLYEVSGVDQTVGNILEAGSVMIDQTAQSAQLTTPSDSMLTLAALGLEPQGGVDLSPELVTSGGHTEDASGFTGTPLATSDICFAFASGVIATAGADTAGWAWTTAADAAITRIAIGGA